jgi:hypothetical protein
MRAKDHFRALFGYSKIKRGGKALACGRNGTSLLPFLELLISRCVHSEHPDNYDQFVLATLGCVFAAHYFASWRFFFTCSLSDKETSRYATAFRRAR